MALPNLVAGVLPPGRHTASATEIEQRFVLGAPSHAEGRRDLWGAFNVWAALVHRHFGPAQVWIAGTFISHISADPDLHVAVLPKTPSMAERAISRGEQGLTLVTLEDVLFNRPGLGGWIDQVRPIGGMLDAVLGSLAEQTALEALWSMGLTSRSAGSTSTDVGYVSLEV